MESSNVKWSLIFLSGVGLGIVVGAVNCAGAGKGHIA